MPIFSRYNYKEPFQIYWHTTSEWLHKFISIHCFGSRPADYNKKNSNNSNCLSSRRVSSYRCLSLRGRPSHNYFSILLTCNGNIRLVGRDPVGLQCVRGFSHLWISVVIGQQVSTSRCGGSVCFGKYASGLRQHHHCTCCHFEPLCMCKHL